MAAAAQFSGPQAVIIMNGLAQKASVALREEPSTDTTRASLKQLYLQAHEMACHELREPRPLLQDGSVLPIISKTYELLILKEYRDSYKLQSALSRVYRSLFEIKWCHAAKVPGGMPLDNEQKKLFIDVTEENIKYFLYKQDDALPAQLEFRIARQAIRMCDTADPLYKKYFIRLCNIAGSAQIGFPLGVSVNISEVTKKVLALVKNLKRDDPSAKYSWYPFVHLLRNLAFRVQTAAEFRALIPLNQATCKKRGGNYSNCMAMVLIDIFKRSGANEELRNLALRGEQGQSEGLLQLANWSRQPAVKDFLKHPIDYLTTPVTHADRFLETRRLTRRFLSKIARNEAYREAYHVEIDQALRGGQPAAIPQPPAPIAGNVHDVINQLVNENHAYLREDAEYNGGPTRSVNLSPEELEKKNQELKRQKSDIYQRAQLILDRLINEAQAKENEELNRFLGSSNV